MSEKQGIWMQKVTSTLNPLFLIHRIKPFICNSSEISCDILYTGERKDRMYTQMRLFWALERQLPIGKYTTLFPSKQQQFYRNTRDCSSGSLRWGYNWFFWWSKEQGKGEMHLASNLWPLCLGGSWDYVCFTYLIPVKLAYFLFVWSANNNPFT